MPTLNTQLNQQKIDLFNLNKKAQHDKRVALMDSMLELQEEYHNTRMERDKEL